MGQMESSYSWTVAKLVFLKKLDAAPTKGIRSYRAIALTSVVSKWYASCILLRLEKEKEPDKWKNLHILDTKHWEWHEERNLVMRDGTVVRPTMYMASLDINTTFNKPKPKRVAKIMDNHNAHDWIIAALLREMSGLSGKAIFECVLSIDACSKETWKPRACGRRRQPSFGPMWRKNG